MDTTPRAPSRPDVAARVAAVSTRASLDGARAKSGSRQVPVSACLIRLHSDYLNAEYGDLDSYYVFVNLRAGWGAEDLSQRP
jgi:integrase/recombinase XerD